MTEPTETIEIENVVASSGIDQELDLEQVGDDLGKTEYNSENFPGPCTDIEPESYSTYLSVGENRLYWSEQADRTSLTTVFDALCDLGITVTETAIIEVQNIVASVDFRHQFNLMQLLSGWGSRRSNMNLNNSLDWCTDSMNRRPLRCSLEVERPLSPVQKLPAM